jgi:2',3'-cyclic-nucleotide 2'-phosphodiesterase (5'-nucleotidase family)
VRESAEHLLLLDSGDALVGDDNLGTRTVGEAIVAGMNLMGYDAMALGPKELSLGGKVLRARIDEAQFPMLSANAIWRRSGELVGDAYAVLRVGQREVGVIGLTRQADGELAEFKVLAPADALSQTLPEVYAQTDTAILLTNLPYRSALELVQKVPGVDLVVAALPDELPTGIVRDPEMGSLVVSAEVPTPRHTGRRVGNLTAIMRTDGSLHGESWLSVPLGRSVPDDPEMVTLLNQFR